MATLHHLIDLDQWLDPLPEFSIPYKLTRNIRSDPSHLPSFLPTVTVLITSITPVTRQLITSAPNLQLVACNGTGTDHVDKVALAERNIGLCHVPAQNTDSVSEHAFALYYAIRRRILELHALTVDGEKWAASMAVHLELGQPAPRTNAEETVVIIGYGALGKNISRLATALGMRVLIAERKNTPPTSTRPGRTPFTEALQTGTVFMIVTPLDATTRNMISTPEFSLMPPTSLLINVGRGGVIDETALLQALREKKIAGAATDVFEVEPATRENNALLREGEEGLKGLNLVLSPHVAWYSRRTIEGTRETVKRNVEGFVGGRERWGEVAWVLRPNEEVDEM